MVRLRPVWMTNHPPAVLWHCWLGRQTCKNRRPYNLYCVGADVKPCSINQSINQQQPWMDKHWEWGRESGILCCAFIQYRRHCRQEGCVGPGPRCGRRLWS